MTDDILVILVGSSTTRDAFRMIETALCSIAPCLLSYDDWGQFMGDLPRAASARILISAGSNPVDGSVMDRLPYLQAIICPFIGIEGFDSVAARMRGIAVANGATRENIESMAEATVLLILESLYDLTRARAAIRTGWAAGRHARMLRGRRVGLLGFGNIAREVSVRLANWGITISAYARRPPENPAEGIDFLPLDDVIAGSDIVSIHLPLTVETRNLLDERRLRSMKPDGILIATSRGGIVDEAALLRVARERPAFRAALDVFAVEPLPWDDALRQAENIILTPHMVGHTRDSGDALVHKVLENVKIAISSMK